MIISWDDAVFVNAHTYEIITFQNVPFKLGILFPSIKIMFPLKPSGENGINHA